MDTWLITGGAGFIGSHFVHMLARSGRPRVIVFDALTYAGNLANIDDLIDGESVVFVHGDLRNSDDVADVFDRFDIGRVVHLAAESHVDRSILGPRTFVETNVTGTLNLLLAAQDRWGKDTENRRFLHVSTDEVYGALAPTDAPFDERTPYAPSSPYAASKAAADHLVRAWQRTYDFPAVITNCSNNYGPRQFPEKLIPLTILNATENRALPVYGDGEQVRDWLHVDDHCRALRTIAEHGVFGETYCIGGGNETSNVRVVEAICDLVDERLERTAGTARALIRHVVDRPGHDRRYAIDSSKLRQDFGWKPEIELSAGLADAVDWYLANKEWADMIRSGEYLRFYSQQYAGRLDQAS